MIINKFLIRKLFFIPVILLMFIFITCAGTTAISHGASSAEKKCTLLIASTLTVTGFDGKAVNWVTNAGDSWMSVQIPEGNHTFILNYKRAGQGSQFLQENIKYEHIGFLAGRTYKMSAEEGKPGINQNVRIIMTLAK